MYHTITRTNRKRSKSLTAINSTPGRWDVVIYEIATRKIDTIAGTNLLSEDRPNHGFHAVEKRVETVEGRLNEHYGAAQVPAGKYKKGDVIVPEDL